MKLVKSLVIVEESDISNKFLFLISVLLCVDYESEIGFWESALKICFFFFYSKLPFHYRD